LNRSREYRTETGCKETLRSVTSIYKVLHIIHYTTYWKCVVSELPASIRNEIPSIARIRGFTCVRTVQSISCSNSQRGKEDEDVFRNELDRTILKFKTQKNLYYVRIALFLKPAAMTVIRRTTDRILFSFSFGTVRFSAVTILQKSLFPFMKPACIFSEDLKIVK